MLVPQQLRRQGDGSLLIQWSDGQSRCYTPGQLRKACPCATCREKTLAEPAMGSSRSLPVLSATETAPLAIVTMRPVGNYAYNIAFSDGHDSGIFTLDLLLRLGSPSG